MAALVVLIGAALALLPATASATPLTSPHYILDPDVANSFGGDTGSADYGLIDSGGEAAIGNSSSTDYRLTIGYVSQLADSIQLALTPSSSLTIPTVTPGTSESASLQAAVLTDAPGYDLAINEDHDLQQGSTTIPPISGSIASPAAWNEGTTTGLGFTVTGGSQVEASWGGGSNYAAIPTSSTTFHSHSGLLGGASDTTTLSFRLDTAPSQPAGSYSNTVTLTATLRP